MVWNEMTTDQTKSAAILLWIHAWKAWSHFLVNLVLLNLRNKRIKLTALQPPFHIQPSQRSFPRQILQVRGQQGVCGYVGKRGVRPKDVVVCTAANTLVFKHWGLNQWQGKECGPRSSFPTCAVSHADLSLGFSGSISHWPVRAGSHPTTEHPPQPKPEG